MKSPYDKSEVIESPLLAVSEPEVRRCNNTNNETTEAELELKLVEKLLQKASIERFDLSYPGTSGTIFPLKRIAHHIVHYVTESILVKMHILSEIKNHIAFIVIVQIKNENLERGILQ